VKTNVITTISVRCNQKILIGLDEWRHAQRDTPSRATAILHLVEQALAGTTAARRRSSGGRLKAAEMADKELNYLGDQKASGAERAHRKHRLIKGPGEFRDIRRDQPKAKN
jgi:hypothetical protein